MYTKHTNLKVKSFSGWGIDPETSQVKVEQSPIQTEAKVVKCYIYN